MKTTILIAMLMAGSAVAGDRPSYLGVSLADAPTIVPSFDIRKCDITPGAVIPPSSPAPVSQVSPETHQSSKVEYSLITLPSGETASVLTFK
jgi:hypothetical protein